MDRIRTRADIERLNGRRAGLTGPREVPARQLNGPLRVALVDTDPDPDPSAALLYAIEVGGTTVVRAVFPDGTIKGIVSDGA